MSHLNDRAEAIHADLPVGLEDASAYPALTIELLARGWREADTRKVLGANALRVLRESE